MSNEFEDKELLATPRDFASEQFALNNLSIYERYMDMRVQGHPSGRVFRILFGEAYVGDNLMQARIYALENNPYYRREFPRKLEAIKIQDLWNPKVAVHELISLVRDPYAKESARLSAMKELNVITKIVIIDESGQSKPGRTLDDFYAKEGLPTPESAEPAEITHSAPPTTH
jgi:hypothetical protein